MCSSWFQRLITENTVGRCLSLGIGIISAKKLGLVDEIMVEIAETTVFVEISDNAKCNCFLKEGISNHAVY
jgi:hypothetical protein